MPNEDLYLDAYRQCAATPLWAITDARLRLLRQSLRHHSPTEFPVKFRRCFIPEGHWGDCDLMRPKNPESEPYFLIRISKGISRECEWFVTLHEYAHALQWRGPVQETTRLADHDGEWGLAESRVWDAEGG